MVEMKKMVASRRYNLFTGTRKNEIDFGELEQESFNSSDAAHFENMKQEIHD